MTKFALIPKLTHSPIDYFQDPRVTASLVTNILYFTFERPLSIQCCLRLVSSNFGLIVGSRRYKNFGHVIILGKK